MHVRLAILAVIVLHCLLGSLSVAQNTSEGKTSTAIPQKIPDQPEFSEIIPLSAELSAHLAHLKSMKLNLPNLSAIEKDYSEIEERINAGSDNLKRLRANQVGQGVSFIRLRRSLIYDREHLKNINVPLGEAIEQLDELEKEWKDEKQRWQHWRSLLLKDSSYPQIRSAFDDADSTIDRALRFISLKMEPLLAVQSSGARLKVKIESLDVELAVLREETQQDLPIGVAPPMYSGDYYAQFNRELFDTTKENLKVMPWPGEQFFVLHGLAFGVLAFFVILFSVLVYRNRQVLRESENWRFVAENPIATVLFVTSLIVLIQMQFWAASSNLADKFLMVVGSMSCLRLLAKVLKSEWAKKISCGVMFLYAITITVHAIGVPSPVFNFYITVVSLVTLIFCIKWARGCSLSKSAVYPIWWARLLALLISVILIAEVLGEVRIAYIIFVKSLSSMALFALIVLFAHLLRGCIHWIFFSSPLWNVRSMRSDAWKNEHKLLVIVRSAIALFLFLPAVLTTWGLFDSFPDALIEILSLGFEVAGKKISVGLVVAALATLYGSLYASEIFSKLLLDEHILRRKMDQGVRGSIGQLIKYFIIFIGLLLTLSLLGFGLTNVTIILSALGVGIGFGLQGIVNNFVSGIILLFERPIRKGDTIELSGFWARVKRIGLRATIVQTFDESEVIIPNADIINNQVMNWTLSNRQVRLSIPVGVDYSSDISLVVETLQSCAKDHELVLKSPPPEVLFMNLGESSLDFEIRVWIQDGDNRFLVKSQLYQEIVQRFRKAGIVIPFPQRDLHMHRLKNMAEEQKELHPEGISD